MFVLNWVDEWCLGMLGRVLLFYEICVVVLDGIIVGFGVEGDLWVCGLVIVKGYWNWFDFFVVNEGWFDMWDRVCIDSDGWVIYCCCVDDIEVIGGVNVDLCEVE